MVVRAVIQAGGSGTRMVASGVSVPKPLVEIEGMALLEHNVRWLLASGIERISVVVALPANTAAGAEPRAPHPVEVFANAVCREIASAAGAELEVVVEDEPLGNVGGVSLAVRDGETALVVFADNLTTLDPRSLLEHHESTDSALTLAVHDEEFRDPYGVPVIVGGTVVAFEEKPLRHSTIASGISVLSPRGVAALSRSQPTGLVDLCSALLARGESIAAFHHDALWIDVNEASAFPRASRVAAALHQLRNATSGRSQIESH